jgi:hypothetical protein
MVVGLTESNLIFSRATAKSSAGSTTASQMREDHSQQMDVGKRRMDGNEQCGLEGLNIE